MKKSIFLFLLLISGVAQAQLMPINFFGTKTPDQLVRNVLVNPLKVTPLPGSVKYNGVNAPDAFVVQDQAGEWFINNGPTITGFDAGDKGMILTTGKVQVCNSPNNTTSASLQTGKPKVGDPDLAKLAGGPVRNVAIVEFDFVATGIELNFDYVFGSEEYLEYVNSGFNDAFGFFLSGPGLSGGGVYTNDAVNIALIPGTTTGVSINTVNPGSNAAYYVNNPVNSTGDIQYDGITTVLRATSPLECGGTYHIKLAIGNVSDNAYDSGVLLKNFTIEDVPICDNTGLPENTSACYGTTITLKYCDPNTTGMQFVWKKDNVIIPGESGPSIDVTTDGNYCVDVYSSGGCLITSDCYTLVYAPPLPINNPENIYLCRPLALPPPYTVNIDQTAYMLGGQPAGDYTFTMYDDLANAELGGVTGRIPKATWANYVVNTVPKTIYVRVAENAGSGCVEIKPFDIIRTIPSAGTIAYSASAYCNDVATPQLITSAVTPGGVYSATPGPGLLNIDSVTGTIIPNLSQPGAYTVNYDIPANAGCPAYSAPPITVTINPVPTVTVNSPTVCSGSDVTITATPGVSGSYLYFWTVPAGVINPGNVSSFTTTVAGTYSVVITDTTTNCVSSSASGMVTLVPLPTATISGSTTICSGNTAVITFTGTPNAVVNYTVDGNPQSITLNASGTNIVTTPVLTVTSVYSLVSVSDPSTGCSQTLSGTATVTVNPLPTASISGAAVICSGTSTNITFTGTPNAVVTYTVNGGSNTATTLNAGGTSVVSTGNLTQTTSYDLVSIISPSTGCSQTLSGGVTVTVIAAPAITQPTPYVVCDDNYDGVSCAFILQTKDAEISTAAGIQISYHRTLADSQNNANAISKSTPYCNNTSAFTQTLYVRVFDPAAPACASYTTLQLTVNPIPNIKPSVTDYALCDVNASGDGKETFTLSTKDAEIINGQSNMTVSYYPTQADAIALTNPLTNSYQNTSNPQTIWYNIKNTVNTCSAVGSFKLVVNSLPSVTVNSPTVCQGTPAVVTAIPGTAGSYTYAWTVPSPPNPGNVSAFTTMTAGVYSVVITNTVTGCVSPSASGTVSHIAAPVITQPTPYVLCDDNYDGVACFDLHAKDAEISTVSGIQITYYRTLADSQNNVNPITQNPYCNNQSANAQTIYVRVVDPSAPTCYSLTTLQLVVKPIPAIKVIKDYQLCDVNTPGDEVEVFTLSTKDAEIINGQTNMTVSYYATKNDATNAVSPLPNAYPNTSNPQTVWYNIKSSVTGCSAVGSFKLVVDPLPVTQPAISDYILCDSANPGDGKEVFTLATKNTEIINGQKNMAVSYYLTQANATSQSSPLPNSYTNATPNTQTIWYNLKNTVTGCSAVGFLNLVVNPLPMPNPLLQPYAICDNYNDSTDGIGAFDLNDITPLITYQTPGAYQVSYHETQAEATADSNTISLTQPYHNTTSPFVKFLWIRAENPTTLCFSVMQIELNVNPAPQMPTLSPIILCDSDSNIQDGCTTFDLTIQTPIILAAQSQPAANYAIAYYGSQPDAENGTSPIVTPSTYFACNATNGTVWVRIDDIIAGCYNIGSFQLQVNTPTALTTPTLFSKCDDDANPNNMYTTFDMVSFVGTVPDHDLKYYLDSAHTQLIVDPSNFTNTIAANQTVFIVATDNVNQCDSYRTLTLEVLTIPAPLYDPQPLPEKCDDNNPGDGVEVFDLTLNEDYIANGGQNLTFYYYPTQQDALDKTNEITTPTAALVGTNVWIRIENINVDYQGNTCYVLVEQPLKVNPLPTVVQPLTPYRMCDDDTDGLAVFDLTNPALATAILGPNQSLADFTITYYETASGANPFTNIGELPLPSSYQNTTPTSQDIYIRVENNTTLCVNATGVLTLAVEEAAFATGPQTFSDCDNFDDPFDGVHQIDLTQYENAILNGQSPASKYVFSYYTSQSDADAGINAIADPTAYVTQPDTDQVWVKVENSSNLITPVCYALTTIDISVERYPHPIINTPNNIKSICVDFNTNAVVRTLTLDSGIANPANYTFEWYVDNTLIPGANSSTYTVDTPSPGGATRNYAVHVTSTSSLGCDTVSAAFSVLQSGQAIVVPGKLGYEVTNAFEQNQTITVLIGEEVLGYGQYQYSLDDGPRQDSNVFENVPLGTHTITVWDNTDGVAYSCDELVIGNIQIIDYPHYFTPNGDGYHDTWNVVGLSDQPEVKIYIFDRFGKLLKQISSTGEGWDGTYTGQLLPADDYWFRIEYYEDNQLKEFKSHFALKR